MHYKLALIGFGNVARALARLLIRKQDLLKKQYDVTFSFTGIATGKHGFAVNTNGLDIQEALELVEDGIARRGFRIEVASKDLDVAGFIHHLGGRVVLGTIQGTVSTMRAVQISAPCSPCRN